MKKRIYTKEREIKHQYFSEPITYCYDQDNNFYFKIKGDKWRCGLNRKQKKCMHGYGNTKDNAYLNMVESILPKKN